MESELFHIRLGDYVMEVFWILLTETFYLVYWRCP
jgi:hypothetical protein